MAIIAANWKMHKTLREAEEFLEAFDSLDKGDSDVLFFVPFTALPAFSGRKGFGSQNMHHEEKGAFTGEISSRMLKEYGCTHVLLGHSERRNIFKEDDELINKKVISALSAGFTVILCVGESYDERKEGKAVGRVGEQLKRCLDNVEYIENIIVAYEPVWAIGTGETATPQQAQGMHSFIKSWFGMNYPSFNSPRVLYGGSANPENFRNLLKEKDIDGLLIGGASLDPEKLAKMCR